MILGDEAQDVEPPKAFPFSRKTHISNTPWDWNICLHWGGSKGDGAAYVPKMFTEIPLTPLSL